MTHLAIINQHEYRKVMRKHKTLTAVVLMLLSLTCVGFFILAFGDGPSIKARYLLAGLIFLVVVCEHVWLLTHKPKSETPEKRKSP
jgi:hypothetical protein